MLAILAHTYIVAGKKMKLTDSITTLSGVGEQTAQSLRRLGVETIQDLLFYLPFRFEDRSKVLPINSLRPGEEAVIAGEIGRVHGRRTKRGGFLVEARVSDGTGEIPAIWFNQRFLLSQLKVGEKIMLFGAKKLAPTIGNPFVVKQIITEAEIAPIYSTTKGLRQGVLRKLIRQTLPLCSTLQDVLTKPLQNILDVSTRREAIANIHAPTKLSALESARKLLAVEELLGLALSVLESKRLRQNERAEKMLIDTDFLKQFVAGLPFALTTGQRRAAWEIIQGMTEGYPANRLLYGEVGAGKTIVALLAAIATVRAGKRAIFLVPTTTLADQQVTKIHQFVGEQFSVSLVTGTQKETSDNDIIVGTHALLNRADSFSDVGLIVIDEQQRFGVRQRQKLLAHHPEAHLLMTTATPIPRSLAQTLFGNLEITYLLDKPAHQRKITTKRFQVDERASIMAIIRQRINDGEPGYVICPAIVEQEAIASLFGDDKKSVIQEVKQLQKELPLARIAAMHGQLKDDQKQQVMKDFASGKLDVLVATTVVEVGIDNPHASWIIIENAEMFGLSSLHQLRGRVGRGERASVCFLAEPVDNELATQRLEALERSDDGLALSELDLQLRGPGEVMGSEQSGLPDLRYADLSDKELIAKVFEEAQKIVNDGIEKYPSLKSLIKNVDGLAAS